MKTPESTKQLCTFLLKILEVRRNKGVCDLDLSPIRIEPISTSEYKVWTVEIFSLFATVVDYELVFWETPKAINILFFWDFSLLNS